ncbi:hypothetical protein [Vitiosangium sp. GDMCC 1.1324]|uniref:hypothetical protein n=1 Tax=Vitiosangium sp. (strain GDMCC 1.1324) TaxID=2138576 RepID=UPI000D34DA18|nr:hypothetical protein [Vitiosangium sp. GDMCC 1.1324]PTL79939.1 hypothetical protein DAT35_31440 [Vitiosangium sp. GDMCC 1.1324]
MPFHKPPCHVSPPTRPRHRGGRVRAGLFSALLLLGSTAAAQPATPPAKPSALNNGSAAEASAYYKKLAKTLNFLTPATIESKANMQELLNYLGYSELSPEVVEFEAPEKLMGGGSNPPTASAFPYCGKSIELKSWKGDSLNRPDTAQGVTTSTTGAGNLWTAECVGDKVRLKSSKGDYLHRPDSNQGITTWHTGPGNDWTAEFTNGKLMLKSWKGDYLHRPDSVQGVTTFNTGIGNQWTVVERTSAPASAFPYCGKSIELKSWKGDSLNRPDTAQGVTTSTTGTGNLWTAECVGDKVRLKSSKGDYLHRPDSAQGVTTFNTGPGNDWTAESTNGKLMLKSSKGDYLHRPDSAQGVTTYFTGIGNQWTVVEPTSGGTTPPPRKQGDILVSRFFAPKIVNFSVAPEKRNIGWRRLVRINSRPNSEAAKHQVESAWILFNHFTSPPVHSPYGGTPPTEQLKDSPWGKVKIVTPGNMKNGSVNTQVALVTRCTATKEECAEVDSIYWVDFGPSDKGYKLSYQLDAFFDAGNLVAAGDTAGAAPYFVPNGCDTCHGSLKGQAILNLLDTDHWMDRLTDGDFPALARPDAPAPLFDAGKDTKSPQYAAAFDIIRTLNREIADMQRRINNQSFQLAATDKWLQLHQSSVQPEPDLITRAFEFANFNHPLHATRKPTPTPLKWTSKAEDKELVGLLNKYCYRCHGAIRFDVFSKDMIADQTSPMLDRIDPNPTQAKVTGFQMPPDRSLPAKDKQRLLDLLDQLDQETH